MNAVVVVLIFCIQHIDYDNSRRVHSGSAEYKARIYRVYILETVSENWPPNDWLVT
jgi:hypothetical protein